MKSVKSALTLGTGAFLIAGWLVAAALGMAWLAGWLYSILMSAVFG